MTQHKPAAEPSENWQWSVRRWSILPTRSPVCGTRLLKGWRNYRGCSASTKKFPQLCEQRAPVGSSLSTSRVGSDPDASGPEGEAEPRAERLDHQPAASEGLRRETEWWQREVVREASGSHRSGGVWLLWDSGLSEWWLIPATRGRQKLNIYFKIPTTSLKLK